jgi:signal transduction histidine kinase
MGGGWAHCYRGPAMRQRVRNAAAIGIAAACLILGATSWLHQEPPFSGVKLRLDGGTLVVARVDPEAGLTGVVEPGMVVREIDGFSVQDVRPEQVAEYLLGDFSEIGVVGRDGTVHDYRLALLPAPPVGYAYLVGLALLAGIAAWVARGHAGEALRPHAVPLAVASAAPLILVANWVPGGAPMIAAAISLPVVARFVLADAFVEAIPTRGRRRLAAGISLLSGAAYVALAGAIYGLAWWQIPLPEVVSIVAAVLAGSITLVPVGLVLLSARSEKTSTTAWSGRLEERIPVVLAALTPTVIAFGYVALGFGPGAPLFWLLVVLIVLQTSARVDTLRLQRDAVVAATEAERARLAADLHDDALQEMTLLVRRLDDGGDARAASLARSIADRLREVCGELRLPILDELGAGPALEWLVERVGETSGRQVVLERADAARPPADVELAVFRVAQEALANAVAHGAPPITVRYDAGLDRAALSITDHGVGLSADTASAASRAGHYGLLNMRQRAEQIGARLDVTRPPDGGTTIGLLWAPA